MDYRDKEIGNLSLTLREVGDLYDAIAAYELESRRENDERHKRLFLLYQKVGDLYHGLRKSGYRWAGPKGERVIFDPEYKFSVEDLCQMSDDE